MDMQDMLKKMPSDIEKALKLKQNISIKEKIDNIVICGMGGSGIAGDLLRDYLKNEAKLPIIVEKSHSLPKFVSKNTLVIAITYSGRTVETLDMLKDAKKKGAQIITVTSGNIKGKNVIKIPAGLLPRMALPYLFFTVLAAMEKLELIKNQKKAVKETVGILKKFNTTQAKELSEKIGNNIPIIYGPSHFSSVVLRWKTQLNENSKIIAHSAVFTELNHNEINATNYIEFTVIILRDRGEDGKKQIEAAKQLIRNYTEISTKGTSLLARMFYAIYFGDWTSYFLAVKLGKNPAIVPAIDFIKKSI